MNLRSENRNFQICVRTVTKGFLGQALIACGCIKTASQIRVVLRLGDAEEEFEEISEANSESVMELLNDCSTLDTQSVLARATNEMEAKVETAKRAAEQAAAEQKEKAAKARAEATAARKAEEQNVKSSASSGARKRKNLLSSPSSEGKRKKKKAKTSPKIKAK